MTISLWLCRESVSLPDRHDPARIRLLLRRAGNRKNLELCRVYGEVAVGLLADCLRPGRQRRRGPGHLGRPSVAEHSPQSKACEHARQDNKDRDHARLGGALRACVLALRQVVGVGHELVPICRGERVQPPSRY